LAFRARAVIEVVAMTRPGYRASDPPLLVTSTTGRGCKGAARVAHPSRRQRRHPAAEAIPGQGVHVVEVHDTVRWQSIGAGRQIELGDEAAAGTGQCSHDHRADPVSHRVTRQHENRPVAARSCCEPDLTSSHRPSPTNPRLGPSRRCRRALARRRPAVGEPTSRHRSRSRGAGGDAGAPHGAAPTWKLSIVIQLA
jgi:hypothetical protein